MKKDLLSALIDCVCVVFLSVCPLLCYASAFSISYEYSTVIISATIFSFVFSLISAFVKDKLKYALSVTVIAFVALI